MSTLISAFRQSFFIISKQFVIGFTIFTGQNTHLLLSILVKHLDHKNVLKNPNMQLDIVGVITHLAQQTRVQQSVAIIGALSDMMRHLRKSIHCSIDDSNLGAEVIQWNQKYRMEVDECLVQLTIKVTKEAQLFYIIFLVNT